MSKQTTNKQVLDALLAPEPLNKIDLPHANERTQSGDMPSKSTPAPISAPQKRRRAWPLADGPQVAEPQALSMRTRRQRITPKVKAAIEALVSGKAKNLTAAAKIGGLARESLSRALSESKNLAFLTDQARRSVAISSAPAAARLAKLIAGARSEHVQMEATKFALGAAGISPKNESHVSLSVDVKAGFVIDLSPRSWRRGRMKIISSTCGRCLNGRQRRA